MTKAGQTRQGLRMTPISFKRYRFPPEIIQHAVWPYDRFTLSFRDVEELLAERGFDVSNETVRRWLLGFGRLIARNLLSSRPRASARWHLNVIASSRISLTMPAAQFARLHATAPHLDLAASGAINLS